MPMHEVLLIPPEVRFVEHCQDTFTAGLLLFGGVLGGAGLVAGAVIGGATAEGGGGTGRRGDGLADAPAAAGAHPPPPPAAPGVAVLPAARSVARPAPTEPA